MKNDFLLLIEKHTDTVNQQTKIKPQETLEFKLNKQMETFLFNPPKKFVEESKWLLTVIFFQTTNSVFNITVENNSFPVRISNHWNSGDGEELFDKLTKLLELRSEKDIEFHVEEGRKRGNQIKIGDREYNLSDLDTREIDIIKEIKKSESKDLEDMVHRMGLTYYEIVDTLDNR